MKHPRRSCWCQVSMAEQHGVALVVALVILLAVAMLGISAAQIAMQDQKAARNDRDRQLAFQSAEAALLDAEREIEAAANASGARSQQFTASSGGDFPLGCSVGQSNPLLGLCSSTAAPADGVVPNDVIPVWMAVDLGNADAGSTRSAPYGRFTGRHFPIGSRALPARLPRYVIEPIIDSASGSAADGSSRDRLFRITAIGFGARDHSQVVLQSFYRRVR